MNWEPECRVVCYSAGGAGWSARVEWEQNHADHAEPAWSWSAYTLTADGKGYQERAYSHRNFHSAEEAKAAAEVWLREHGVTMDVEELE